LRESSANFARILCRIDAFDLMPTADLPSRSVAEASGQQGGLARSRASKALAGWVRKDASLVYLDCGTICIEADWGHQPDLDVSCLVARSCSAAPKPVAACGGQQGRSLGPRAQPTARLLKPAFFLKFAPVRRRRAAIRSRKPGGATR